MKTKSTATNLGTILVTGGSGFLGKNLVRTLLSRGYKVKSFDLIESELEHENLEVITGDIRKPSIVEDACLGVDTVFHTAALISLKGGKTITKEDRDLSYSINIEATKRLLKALQKAGGSRFIYTASNSVVIEGKPITNGNESAPYTNRFNDLYTETKVISEKWVLAQNGQSGVFTCSIRPSGIWGPGDQTMFKMLFEQILSGLLIARVGDGSALLDNSYVHNLIHGQVLAAEHLIKGGTSPGQAYFINDGEPVNMFDFSAPILEACGKSLPNFKVPSMLLTFIMTIWQALHIHLKFPEPPVPPLAIERIALHNYFSIDKAREELGYEPIYTTQQGIEESKPFYVELFNKMRKEAGK